MEKQIVSRLRVIRRCGIDLDGDVSGDERAASNLSRTRLLKSTYAIWSDKMGRVKVSRLGVGFDHMRTEDSPISAYGPDVF